jgi:zinc transporter, ZIP family
MSSEFLLVIVIALIAALLTWLGAPLAERFVVPQRVISAALQFAAGIITALVALSLMPPAVRGGSSLAIALAFFLGGAVYVVFEYYSARKLAARAEPGQAVPAVGLFVGILVDLFIDGAVIGVGATLTLATGILLALGLAISTMPLAFVTTSTAKQQGVSPEKRRLLSILYIVCIVAGAILGYGLLRNQPEAVRLTLIAFASGFLITTVTQSMIPEANKDGEPSFAGILFLAGLTLYAVLTLTIK